MKFEGKGVDDAGTVAAIKGDKAPGLKVVDVVVKIDSRYFRPTEVEILLGDQSKAKLGWAPEFTVQQMCTEMVATDLEATKKHALLTKQGYQLDVAVE